MANGGALMPMPSSSPDSPHEVRGRAQGAALPGDLAIYLEAIKGRSACCQSQGSKSWIHHRDWRRYGKMSHIALMSALE